MDFKIFETAMFINLGTATKMSKQGLNIIFAEGYRLNGRADLSDNYSQAIEQLHYAGIDIDSVTKADIEQYQAFRAKLDKEFDIKGARIVVSRPYDAPVSGCDGAVDQFVYVALEGGLGDTHFCRRIKCKIDFDPNAKNKLGLNGAVITSPDNDLVNACIADIHKKFPDYSKAPVQNNNEVYHA